jgi:hypothetical protein
VKRWEERRREFIDGLMAVGRFYEQNPGAYYDGLKMTLSMYVDGKGAGSALASTAKAFGKCEKSCDEKYTAISKRFGRMVSVELFALRSEVCQRVVLGTRVEPSVVIPATRAARIPESVVEIVGWICDPLLVHSANRQDGLNAILSKRACRRR